MKGLERINVLASEIKDKPSLKIVDYLLTREDMNEKYLNEEKTLKQMITFIKSEAEKKAVNGVVILEDEEVYGLAIHYFDETNEKLNFSKQQKTPKSESKKVEKIEIPKTNKKSKKWVSEGQLSLFDFECM